MIGKMTNKFKLVVMSALMLGATSAYDYHHGHHQDHHQDQHYTHQDHQQHHYNDHGGHHYQPPEHHTDDNSPIPHGKLPNHPFSRKPFEVFVCCQFLI